MNSEADHGPAHPSLVRDSGREFLVLFHFVHKRPLDFLRFDLVFLVVCTEDVAQLVTVTTGGV